MTRRERPIIGITLGDPAGIGPEVVAKALRSPAVRRLARFHIIGDARTIHRYFPREAVNCSYENLAAPGAFHAGAPNRASAAASLTFLTKAVALLRQKKIDALVTAPVCKESISHLGKKFHGHTEFLARAFGVKNFEMMFTSDSLKTVIITRHVPLTQVSRRLSPAKIYRTIVTVDKTLKRLFGIKKPHIAVCGLNPHAGEGGLIGREEITKIIPAIQKARRRGIRLSGPLAADTLFASPKAKQYDTVIAMYHDQGLIPVKTLYFRKVTNLTLGLPFVRTSPAHGTAFDIAGKNKADASSMAEAIKLAARLSRD